MTTQTSRWTFYLLVLLVLNDLRTILVKIGMLRGHFEYVKMNTVNLSVDHINLIPFLTFMHSVPRYEKISVCFVVEIYRQSPRYTVPLISGFGVVLNK